MKITIAIIFYTISILSFVQNPILFRAKNNPMKHEISNQLKIQVTIGNKKFDATLLDNETALAFKALVVAVFKLLIVNEKLPTESEIVESVLTDDHKFNESSV